MPAKGWKLSEESKKRIGEANKIALLGNIPWNKGKKLSLECRKKLSTSHLGQKAWNKGIPHTDETKSKISFTKLGTPAWNKGKNGPSPSIETRLKIRQALLGKPMKRRFPNGIIDYAGYKRIRVNCVYVLEHKHIMEKHLGRKLKKNECVHHIDLSKTNNKISNLKLMTNSEHISYHRNLTLKEKELLLRSQKST